MNFALELYFSF